MKTIINSNNQHFTKMKKIKFFALMSAIALTCTIGFTACSSSDEATADVNPTYDGSSVRTDFAFNITKASQGTTRMTAENVQETSGFSFRGMSDMFLLSFHGIPGTSSEATANYPLGNLISGTDITSTKSSKVYSLSIPVGTDNFLFYGKASRSGESNYAVGRVSSSFYDVNGNRTTAETSPLATADQKKAEDIKKISDIQFSLTPVQTSLGDDATKLAAYLTSIANTTGWEGTVTLSATDGRYSSLADLYTKFTSNNKARSGSVESITRLILDLYKSAKAINAASSVTEVQTIANAIVSSTNPGTGVRIIVNENSSTNPDNWTASSANLTDATFPAGTLGLPMGAAQLQWDATNKKFIYNDSPYYAAGGTTSLEANTALNKYCYPAELLYFDNSPLRSTDSYKTISDYPTSVANWDADLGGTGAFDATWTGSEVQSSTRAVAMRNNVNYGVSLLESLVQLNTTSLKDNKTMILGSPTDIDQTISLGSPYTVGTETKTRAITLNGILIGGQPGTVDWQMLPQSTAFDHVIYDKTLPAGTWSLTTTTPTEKFYTVTFDNFTTATPQNKVLVALEFVNNTGMDFYGVNGMIPAGNTFYLVGELDPVNAAADTWLNDYPANYRIPEAGTRRVFGQDHKTIARFYIGGESLKKAYSTIPDLRSTEVLFGLSVDLEWKTGMTFNVNL